MIKAFLYGLVIMPTESAITLWGGLTMETIDDLDGRVIIEATSTGLDELHRRLEGDGKKYIPKMKFENGVFTIYLERVK